MKKISASILLLLLFGACNAQSIKCSTERAIQADHQIQTLKTWSDAASFYLEFKSCMDGEISEEYTDFLAGKLAASDGISSLLEEVNQKRWFQNMVAKRMLSETISLEVSKKIVLNLKRYCATSRSAKIYCQRLLENIVKTCGECENQTEAE